VGLVAKLAGKLDQLQRSPAEVEILFGQIRRHHAVAWRDGPVNGQFAEIVKRFHGG